MRATEDEAAWPGVQLQGVVAAGSELRTLDAQLVSAFLAFTGGGINAAEERL